MSKNWRLEDESWFPDRDGNGIRVYIYISTDEDAVVRAVIDHKNGVLGKTYKGETAFSDINRWIHDNTLHLIHG